MHVDMDIEAMAPVLSKANAAANLAGVVLVLTIVDLPLQLHRHLSRRKFFREFNGLYDALTREAGHVSKST
jgi:hypothetical protein